MNILFWALIIASALCAFLELIGIPSRIRLAALAVLLLIGGLLVKGI